MKIGEILVGNGIITPDQLEEALEYQRKNGGLIGMVLIKLNYITKDDLTQYLKAQ